MRTEFWEGVNTYLPYFLNLHLPSERNVCCVHLEMAEHAVAEDGNSPADL